MINFGTKPTKYNSSRLVSLSWAVYSKDKKFQYEKDFIIKPKGFIEPNIERIIEEEREWNDEKNSNNRI